MITYYISTNGNDNNNGTSILTPIKTINKVNSLPILPGDRVLFNRGNTWIRANNDLVTLHPKSGSSNSYVTYSNYGDLNNPLPVLTMAINISNGTSWQSEGSNIWSAAANADVGNMMFNNKTSFGIKKWSQSAMKIQGDYFYNSSSHTVKLYSKSNPGIYYKQIIAALRPNVVTGNWNTHHYIFDGIHFSMAGGEGIELGGVNNIIIRNCDFSYIGGSEQSPGTGIRFGNAIEFWNDAHDTLVERNRIWEVYDAAMTTQGDSGVKHNQYFYNNIVWNSEYGFEFWHGTTTADTVDNIRIENNTFYNSGGGWVHAQRSDPRGVAFNCFNSNATITNVYIRNNLFLEATEWLMAFEIDSQLSSMIIDYNGFANSTISFNGNANLALCIGNGPTPGDNTYMMSQFALWKSNTGKDAHSILNQTNNFVLNAQNKDLHLKSGSPAIDTGIILSYITNDYDGISRPQGLGYDIGAYEFQPPLNNLILNSSFVNGIPDNWERYQSGTKAIFNYPELPGRDGTGTCISIQYQNLDSNNQSYWSQAIIIDPARIYTVSAYMKTDSIDVPVNTTGGAIIQIDWYDDTGYISSSTILSDHTGTIGWTKFEKTSITPPTNALKANIILRLKNCTGKIWFDDIFFGY